MADRGTRPLLDLYQVEVNDEPVELAHDGTVFAPLLLPHDRSTLRFSFSGQSFRNPSRVSYSYRLEGFDEHASRPSPVEWCTYAKLPPGRYVFEVSCTTGDGFASEALRLPVEIVPAFWQSASFRGFLVLLGLAAVAGVVRWRTARVRAHNVELERLVASRTAELAAANEALRRIAITDPLTGIYNRRFFEEDVRATLATTLRSFHNVARGAEVAGENCHLGFFMVDLDHFKRVNDSYDHETGDAVLKQFTEVLLGKVRTSDTVFRWGGEEFLVLARNTNPGAVRVLAERLRAAVAEHSFTVGLVTLRVTCSIGYATYPFADQQPDLYGAEELVELADHALYLAKNAGRNGWVGVRHGGPRFDGEALALLRRDLLAGARAGLVTLESNLDLDGPEVDA